MDGEVSASKIKFKINSFLVQIRQYTPYVGAYRIRPNYQSRTTRNEQQKTMTEEVMIFHYIYIHKIR